MTSLALGKARNCKQSKSRLMEWAADRHGGGNVLPKSTTKDKESTYMLIVNVTLTQYTNSFNGALNDQLLDYYMRAFIHMQ